MVTTGDADKILDAVIPPLTVDMMDDMAVWDWTVALLSDDVVDVPTIWTTAHVLVPLVGVGKHQRSSHRNTTSMFGKGTPSRDGGSSRPHTWRVTTM